MKRVLSLLLNVSFALLAHVPGFAAPVATAGVTVKFNKADLKPSCAPNDATATALNLRTDKGDFPHFNVTGWNTEFVGQTPGTYLITEGGKDHYATYCPTDGVCEPVKKLNVKIKMDKSGKGTAEFEFTTKSGLSAAGTLPVRFAVGESVACG